MNEKNWGLWLLTALVVGNMVGSGIFMLPSTLAQIASPMGVTIAWIITGFGVLMIALVFGKLSIRRPDLTAGPQSYARALFQSESKGKLAGFSMVWGYWVANWISNVAIITSLAGYLSTFFPVMGSSAVLFTIGGQPIEAGRLVTFIVCTILLWGTHYILITNLNAAGKLNFVATVSKVIGFLLFIVAALFAFQSSNLGEFYTTVVDAEGQTHNLASQINLVMISTLWAFVGIESAVILSGRAKSQRDVSRATVIGLFIALIIYMGITMLIMGILPQEVLRASDKPFVDALSAMVGDNGGTIMGVLAVISLFGATIGWVLLSSEVPYQAAKSGIFPAYFAKVNKNGSPVRALTVTNAMSQIFIFSTISGTISEAYTFLTTSATLAYLIPYLVSAIFFLMLTIKGETYDLIKGPRVLDGIIAALALVYSLYVIRSGTADLQTFSLGIGLFLAGFIIYPIVNRKKSNN
ncbi:arginine:ornithine antiporter [Bacillus canaveralius]|uniref:Arginine:ornithine antiporter n=1 Tax=Bacillus canaveralius TaxID=1403243 RepID=A0A2N5GM80_9BACI|nr:amino acid permease [Bacillus canaveralius]PLR82924.1 arginine:ornithine antiporter [Bacillus canaveralius]PLR97071.1 arginine:ornithine antiporter [Bacillus canaveralius]